MKNTIILILICCFLGFGCAKTGRIALIEVPEGAIVHCSEGSPEVLNPAFTATGTTFDVTRQIFDKLVYTSNYDSSISRGLAEKWDVSEDGREYTFYLRKGVKFHTIFRFTPTRDFNADDVIFTFMRQFDKSHPYHKIGGSFYEYFNAMSMPDVLREIVKIDDYTVKFVLNRPDGSLLANLGMEFSSIFSAEYADNMMKAGTPEIIDFEPAGTGPFRLVAYQKDAVIRYTAHPDHWASKSPIDNLVFAITLDSSVRYQKLKAGECHSMKYPNPSDLIDMRRDRDIELREKEGLNIGYLAYNTKVAPFDKVKVRKALNMAINKQAILDAVFQGAGKAAKNPIPPTIWSYNDDIIDDPYDPAAAKEILEREGVRDLTMKIWVMPVQRPYNPNARLMAKLLQTDFAQIGVRVETVSYEWGEYLTRSKNENRDGAVLLGWTGDNGDPDNFLSVLLSCDNVGAANRSNWCHQPFEDLIQRAKVVADPGERARLYKEAQVIFKEQVPWATIAHSVMYLPVSANEDVGGYAILKPNGGVDFYPTGPNLQCAKGQCACRGSKLCSESCCNQY